MAVRLLLLVTVLLGACSEAQTPPTAPRAPTQRTVVVTDPQLACLVGRMLASDVRMEIIAPPDPESHDHTWAPTREQARMIRDATMVVTGGAGADGWLDLLGVRSDRLERVSDAVKDDLIVVSSDSHSHGASGSHSHVVYAPRPWLDPRRGVRILGWLSDTLTHEGLSADNDERAMGPLRDIFVSLRLESTDTLVVSTSASWHYPAEAVGASVAIVEQGTDPVWVRVEVNAAQPKRVVLVGDLDAQGVRAALEGSSVEVIAIEMGEDECSWLDALEAFAKAIRASE